MNKLKLSCLIFMEVLTLIFNGKSLAQTPNFGSAANFALFSSNGAISNTGLSKVTGDIGTNAGAISGFDNSTIKGNIYNADIVSIQAQQDLMLAYSQLFNTTSTNTTHAPVFGNGEILTGGVYALPAAGSITGTLYLDAGGDSSKIFIFKIGGAFNTAASSTVQLINGASACNVFWVAEGAIGLAANTIMVGTLLAHNAANAMGAGCSLQGRAYSTTGAVSTNTVTVSIPLGCKITAQSCTNNPVITAEPQSAKICNGQSYTFNVGAAGANLTYQWRKDGADIFGAIFSSYTITTTTPAAAGKYYVVIVGSCSPFISSAVDTLQILTPGFNLGSTANFVVFTSSGAVSNTGVSNLTGDIGTNAGAITGFEVSTVNGSYHNADSVAVRCARDLQDLYNQLNIIAPTNSTHVPVFGNGETLLPGVYSIAAAASVNGMLTLDGAGDSSKIFIFKIGGAFTTSAGTVINLINGASSCNIFWVAEGAISMGASTTMKGTLIANNAAISMAAGGMLDGRLFSTFGAASFDHNIASKPVGCNTGTRWTGAVSTDWFSACNWNFGLIPTDTTKITIPAGLTNYPVVSAGNAYAADIVIQKNALLTVSGGILTITGMITDSANFDATAGTIILNNANAQTLGANIFVNNTIQKLVTGNDLTLGGFLNLTGSFNFISSNTKFNTGDFLTLKSTATATAGILDLTNGGTLSGNTITGNVVSELYIVPKRAWRLLSGQACVSGPLTINGSWQEGSTGNDPAPGYGTQITGGLPENGFDQGINQNNSIKIYNNIENNLANLPSSPGTNTPLTNYPGYLIFIRGNRSTDLKLGTSAPVTPTILRVKGAVNIGNISQNIKASNFTLVGNPYLASINFHTLTKKNVTDKMYRWDPKLNGNYGVGGYVTFIYDTKTQTYDITSSVSQESQFVPRGEAFFVESEDGINTGNITFKETDKTSGGNSTLFRPMNPASKMRVDLFGVNADSSTTLMDGVLTSFDNNNNNGIDNNDAKKIYNLSENICLLRDSIHLAIERRMTTSTADTSFLQVYLLKKRTYKLLINTNFEDIIGLTAIVYDRFLNSNIPINLRGITEVYFTVTSDSASFGVDRFGIIFKKQALLPVHFITVKATLQQKKILIEFTTANELNIASYEVQHSNSDTNFSPLATIKMLISVDGKGSYAYLDAGLRNGINYYRIKATNFQNENTYSKIVMVPVSISTTKNMFVIGNPVKYNKLKLRFNNIDKGLYNLEVYSSEGRLIKKALINYTGLSAVQDVDLGNNIAAGKYKLVLRNKELTIYTSMVKE